MLFRQAASFKNELNIFTQIFYNFLEIFWANMITWSKCYSGNLFRRGENKSFFKQVCLFLVNFNHLQKTLNFTKSQILWKKNKKTVN